MATMNSARNFVARQPLWLVLAVASGTCAAINGVFAKLTTTSLTTTWSHSLSALLGLSPDNTLVNLLLRSLFFGLNVAFNILMWTLFTAALTRASSTTRVSIINVSANFMVTAVLGAMIFSEKLSGRWWIGAALLAAGNVVIGRREEAEVRKDGDGGLGHEGGAVRASLDVRGEERAGEEEQVMLMDQDEEHDAAAADIIDLGDEDLAGKNDTRREEED